MNQTNVITAKDRMEVEAAHARMQDATDGHPYLKKGRSIADALLSLVASPVGCVSTRGKVPSSLTSRKMDWLSFDHSAGGAS